MTVPRRIQTTDFLRYLHVDPCPYNRRMLSRKIAQDVGRFLAGGGEIEELPGIEERPHYARRAFYHKEGSA